MAGWLDRIRKASMPATSAPEGAHYLGITDIMRTGGTGSIRDVSPSLWFSPLQPTKPVAPEGTRVRQYSYSQGSNLIWTPGSEDTPKIGFDILRNMADSWDLLRLAIETLKDRLVSQPWEIRLKQLPGEPKKSHAQRMAQDPRLMAVNAFFQFPDGQHDWKTWLRELLEDMMVIDAPAIYLERDLKGRVANAQVIDGATISRQITDQGFTPSPPSVAYQQVLYGLPAINLTTNDLIYQPRNPRTWKRYGFGAVEQIMVTIAIGLRRQAFQLQYYTEGNIPEALCFLPPELPINQVKEVQDWFDSMLSGNLGSRRRLRFLPSAGMQTTNSKAAPSVIFPKEPLLKDEMDVWLWQIVAYAIGVQPNSLMKMINRASGQQMNESAEEEGLQPKLEWVDSVVNKIIQTESGFHYTDMEFKFTQRQELDPEKQAQIDVAYVDAAIISRNVVRVRMGEDEDPSPEASMLMITTATGAVPLGADDAAARAKLMAEAAPKPEPGAGLSSDKKAADSTKDQKKK